MGGTVLSAEVGDGKPIATLENVEIDKSIHLGKHNSKTTLKLINTHD